jgi:hypothetical protein
VITFAAIAVAGFVGGHRVDEFLVHFGRGGAALLLATPGRRSTAKAGPRPCWPRGASGSATPPAWPAPGRVRPSSDGRPNGPVDSCRAVGVSHPDHGRQEAVSPRQRVPTPRRPR